MGNVTRREFVIGGSAALAVSPWLVSPVFAAPQTIKIGAIYPLTGNLASTGLDDKRGVELAVEHYQWQIRSQPSLGQGSGGLPDLGGAKLEMVWADTKGEAEERSIRG